MKSIADYQVMVDDSFDNDLYSQLDGCGHESHDFAIGRNVRAYYMLSLTATLQAQSQVAELSQPALQSEMALLDTQREPLMPLMPRLPTQ